MEPNGCQVENKMALLPDGCWRGGVWKMTEEPEGLYLPLLQDVGWDHVTRLVGWVDVAVAFISGHKKILFCSFRVGLNKKKVENILCQIL